MAIPTFVDSSSASTNAASANVTCNYPAGSASGDLLVMSVVFRRSTATAYTVATPSGWTLIETQDNSATAPGMYGAVFWRWRGAETDVTVTASIGTLIYATATIHAYRGDIDPVNPIDTSASTLTNTTTTDKTVPSITPSTPYGRLAAFVHIWKTSSSAATFPSPYVKQQEYFAGTTADMSAYSGDSSVTYGAVATGTVTVNTGAFSSSAGWFAAHVAIRSARTPLGKPEIMGVIEGYVGQVDSQSWDYPSSKSGDLMLLSLYLRGSAATRTVTTPSDWTLLGSDDQSGSFGTSIYVYWRFRSSETSVTTDIASGSTMYHSTIITAIDGDSVEPTTPVYHHSIATNMAGGTNHNAASIDTSSNNIVVLGDHYDGQGGVRTITWDGAATEIIDICPNSGYYRGLSSAWVPSPPSGGSTVYTATASSASAYRVQTTAIAVQPVQNLDIFGTDTASGAAQTASVTATTPGSDTGSGASQVATVGVAASDVRTSSESASVTATRPVTDSGTRTETASVVAVVTRTDAGSASESTSIVATRPAADSATRTETATITVVSSDIGTFTEKQAGIGQETGSFGETARVFVASSDGIIATDSAYSANGVINGDSGGTSETVRIVISRTDSATRTETASVTAVVTRTDAGLAAETSRVIIYASDGGAATETSRVQVRATDGATGTDTASIIVTIFASDGATGTEATVVEVRATDSGAGTETQFRLVSGLLQFPRMVKIPADDRRIIIEREPRRVSIDPDYRVTSIRPEVRRHYVIAPDKRVFRIDAEE